MFEGLKNFFKNLKSKQIILLILSLIGLILLIIGWFKQSNTKDPKQIDDGQTILMTGLVFTLIGVFGYLMYTKNQEVTSEKI